MRKLFIIFLLCTLPLRVWAAQSMALTMGLPALGDSSVADMMMAMEDCPMAQDHLLSGDAPGDLSADPGCQSCELCMSFGAGPSGPLISSQFLRSPPPLADEPFFISTLPLPRIKPPIA